MQQSCNVKVNSVYLPALFAKVVLLKVVSHFEDADREVRSVWRSSSSESATMNRRPVLDGVECLRF